MGKGGGGGGVGRTGIQTAMQYWSPTVKPRNMMFRNLASALATGGGKGFKMPFVQQAVARSRSAGNAALANAHSGLRDVDPSIRSRVINRLSQQNTMSTKAIPTRVASGLIEAAPSLVNNAGGQVVGGMGIAGAGEEAATRNAAIRAQGFSALASGIAGGIGSAAGRSSVRAEEGSSGNANSWFDWFRRGASNG